MLLHSNKNHHRRQYRQSPNGRHRPIQACEIRDDSRKQSADGVAHIPPKAENTNTFCPLLGVGKISDGGEEGGIHDCRTQAKQSGEGDELPVIGGRNEQEQCQALQEHPPEEHLLFAKMVGQFTGGQLPQSPDDGVDGNDQADLLQREMLGGQSQYDTQVKWWCKPGL